ncbi:tRNA-specific adenosine deaminase [Serratia rubidaea]|uniref:tRNA-specific adenosine deaminase n=1 Tax=Serratia rubidaea TaxID=61652 RepID=A0A4U9HNV0_SERRU|nr:tRNA-specific adenosine deaminase [Serratia rubidaea]
MIYHNDLANKTRAPGKRTDETTPLRTVRRQKKSGNRLLCIMPAAKRTRSEIMSEYNDDYWMRQALTLAQRAQEEGEVP